jgi:hypothetical protein
MEFLIIVSVGLLAFAVWQMVNGGGPPTGGIGNNPSE